MEIKCSRSRSDYATTPSIWQNSAVRDSETWVGQCQICAREGSGRCRVRTLGPQTGGRGDILLSQATRCKLRLCP